MSAELARNMRGRIEQCRRLAKSTTDPRAAGILRQMADEVEADLRKLESEMEVPVIMEVIIPPPEQA